MKRFIAFAAALFLTLGGVAQAQEYATKEEARQLIERAVAHYDKVGRTQAFADFHKPGGEFLYRDLYLSLIDDEGVTVVQGMSPKLVGQKRMDQTDSNGKPYIKEAVELGKAKGEGWVEYMRTNPQSKKIEHKISFVKRHDNVTWICGAYKTN